MMGPKRILFLMVTACGAIAWAQPTQRQPLIGYVYPAGGCQGSVFEIIVGGQFLRGATDVYVSGDGVSATVIQHYRPMKNLDREQRQELIGRLKEVRDKRLAELPEKARRMARQAAGFGWQRGAQNRDATGTKEVQLPDHPLLRNLEDKSLKELHHIASRLLQFDRKRQPNAQIAETVLIEVAVEPDASPGDRELRLGTPFGLTSPMIFQVGMLPEVCEQEPNDPKSFPRLPPDPPIDLPVLLNGQITPGDVDRFRFRARQGQGLVIEAQARRLVPYLADAVPGWFQATLCLYDAEGHEVAFADDYRFDPDPVLFYKIPEDGVYEVDIRDAIYRGREDFAYRIAVSEQPFITGMFPLGGREGVRTVASIEGWNLPRRILPLNTRPGGRAIRHAALRGRGRLSNPVPYAVDTLPECEETEPNDAAETAQEIHLPRIVNGRIDRSGDVDVFQFHGRAGDDVVTEVLARRLNSPLDSLIRLIDASGDILEWNDDREDRETGLLTHHADSYLCASLPEDGTYCIQLTDSQNHGGEAHAYRLRISPPRPDFALRITPSSLNLRAGRVAPVTVQALRKDGFDGDIELKLIDAPDGFSLSGARVPAGRDSVRMTLTAPAEGLDQPAALRLEGRARIGGRTVRRPVVPAEEMMQAFIYQHLVPSQELRVAVTGTRYRPPAIEIASEDPIRIPEGGAAQVHIMAGRRPVLRSIQMELNEAPEGLSLGELTQLHDGVRILVKADGEALQVGYADNLIVELFREMPAGHRDGRSHDTKRRFSVGILPAIPFEIVERSDP
jgi:hypothetical protein